MTIKRKLVGSILTFFTIMICVIIIISYLSFSNSSHNSNLENLDLTSAAISKTVEERMNNYFSLLELSAKMFSSALTSSPKEILSYRISILDDLRNQLGVKDSYFALKDGSTYGSTYSIKDYGIVPPFNARDANREWYTRIFSGEKRIVTTPYVSTQGENIMALGVGVNIEGILKAVMCINLPLTEITDFSKEILDFENIYLTRSNGYLMASNRTDNIGKNLFEIIPELEDINKLKVDSRFNFSMNGEEYVGSFTIINSLGWKAWAYEKLEIINTASRNNLELNILMAFISLTLSTIIIIIISNSISKPLNIVTSSLKEISEGGGNLTKEIFVNSRDETYTLAQSFNSFTQNLKQIVIHIKASSINNNNISANLNNSSTHAASASLQITKNVDTIGEQIKLLDSNINETTSGIFEISSNVSQFKLQIDEQVSAVEESSASIEEMIASLDNVSTITNKKLESTKRLVQTTKEGEKLLIDTSVSFKEGISDKIESIKDMVDVISNISERTNLLAMNAAIEAAHAGEAGKGFAVVSDEIRKMAEEAAHSSKSISEIISIIINAINSTDLSMDNTSKAFSAIFKEVTEIDIALNEIASNTIELASGGHEILKAVSLLKDTTSNISNGVNEIEIGTEDVTKAMVEVQDISSEVFSGVNEITAGMNEVSASFQEVSDLAINLEDESKKLTKEVDRFII